MYSLIILLLVSSVQTQQDLCRCLCCRGQSCSPVMVGTFNVSSCTANTCLAQCRTYSQCQLDYPNGVASPECSTSTLVADGLFTCQCSCCNTGSTLCTPTLIGESTAYVCSPYACSISCNAKYPNYCVENEKGLSNGTCIGPITTTTTTTTSNGSSTTGSWLGNTCSCMCCKSGPDCSPNIAVGLTSASTCSSAACTQTCQTQYPFDCPSLSYLGQTNGTCTNQNSGSTRCECQCCRSNGCLSYPMNILGTCELCGTACRQQSQCINPVSVTYTCNSNKSIRLPVSVSIFIVGIVSTLFLYL